MVNDIGKCVGIYFYSIALIHVISIFVLKHFTNNLYIDLQFIGHIAAGYFLMKHHEKARKIVVIACGLFILVICGAFLYTTFATLPESASWQIMGFPIKEDNAEKYLRFSALIAGIVYLIPFFLLRSEKAIKEFNNQ